MTLNPGTLIGGASDKHDRRASDFYATERDVTVALCRRHPDLVTDQMVWEPACGDGDMSEVLTEFGASVFSSDIRHTGYGAGGIDFLNTTLPGPYVTITNPPFSLAAEFIRKAFPLGARGALLLKATYWHAVSRVGLFDETRPTWVHPLTWRPTFAPERGKSPTMDMIWTVWDGTDSACRYEPLRKPK